MRVGRILSPVHSLGPGERICLWTQGCNKSCIGCISPELQNVNGVDISEMNLYKIICQVSDLNNCTGLTVSGGDPFEQPECLLNLLKLVRTRFDDILVYTGFTIKEIHDGCASDSGIQCLDYIDVLIDGRYIKALNKPDCVLRGSENQIIHFLDSTKVLLYEEYMQKGRILETFIHNQETIITGILNEVSGHE